jgi:hypothetical protein
VVEYLKDRDPEQQKSLLERLDAASSLGHQAPPGATTKLDNLYTQILNTCLVDERDRDDSTFQDCLSILHTFLCTIEQTSPAVAVGILNSTRDESKFPLSTGDATGILR